MFIYLERKKKISPQRQIDFYHCRDGKMKEKGARFFSKSTLEVLSPGLTEKPGSKRRKGGKCSGWKGILIYCHVGNYQETHVFSMWNLKPISIYIICFQKKKHVFSIWDKKPFGLNTST
jgi:hypothetical protein